MPSVSTTNEDYLSFLLESKIKFQLNQHFKQLGFKKSKNGLLVPNDSGKSSYRKMHEKQRADKKNSSEKFLQKYFEQLLPNFANGKDINPSKISPRLELVGKSSSFSARLFRLACLTWSIPVSEGYGRRIRFLVWDEHNNKLIGLIALGDPVFNLKVRDDLIGWSGETRKNKLVNIMDAFVLGALPPYNKLLGGKLVACLVRSKEVSNLFSEKYRLSQGIISKKKKTPKLTIVTTSSALGKSSVYNRLKLGGIKYFESIGYTSGWGHFHVPDDLFDKMRTYLRMQNDNYVDKYHYGSGPNWKIRIVKRVLSKIGLKPDLMKHGLSREVFLCKLASNSEMFLKGESQKTNYENLLTISEISDLAKERWIVPRSIRNASYKLWGKRSLENLIFKV